MTSKCNDSTRSPLSATRPCLCDCSITQCKFHRIVGITINLCKCRNQRTRGYRISTLSILERGLDALKFRNSLGRLSAVFASLDLVGRAIGAKHSSFHLLLSAISMLFCRILHPTRTAMNAQMTRKNTYIVVPTQNETFLACCGNASLGCSRENSHRPPK